MAQHAKLVEALLHGDAFDHPASDREVVQTHISSLVLVGEFAYKLRRPLRLDFLDFSTPELRRADCEEELRLNRRTAAPLYLDVLPVLGTLDKPRIVTKGACDASSLPVLDWALRMRRFDSTFLLDHMARDGTLTRQHIDALASSVAAFHSALPASPPEYGQSTGLQAWVRSNLDHLATSPSARPHSARITALCAWTEREFERLVPLLDRRRAQGFVRECHGDLHLGNIVLIDGVPLPFDCVEFNAELRHIDVMSDVAFTFMDLLRHALPGLAWRCLSAYLEQGGDYAGLRVLPFFAVYRALVRAKVALLRATHGSADQAVAAFERDLTLAEQLAKMPMTSPQMVLACGVSGSGKSTVAQELVHRFGAVRIRSDVERKRLFGLAATERPGDVLYTPEATRRTYERLATLAIEVLSAGLNVIVDAACLLRHERDALRAVASAQGALFTLLECSAAEAVLRKRVAHRMAENSDASDATLQVLEKQLYVRETITSDEGACVLDTEVALETLGINALHCLQRDAVSASLRNAKPPAKTP